MCGLWVVFSKSYTFRTGKCYWVTWFLFLLARTFLFCIEGHRVGMTDCRCLANPSECGGKRLCRKRSDCRICQQILPFPFSDSHIHGLSSERPLGECFVLSLAGELPWFRTSLAELFISPVTDNYSGISVKRMKWRIMVITKTMINIRLFLLFSCAALYLSNNDQGYT